jgi:lantibiotic modifying enzyme
LSGSTGLILLLIEFYKLNNHPRLYSLILKLGKHLVNSSVEIENGIITWEKPFFNKWGGFAHGNSSSSYALFKLAEFSDNRIFFDIAVKALKYDQSLFDESKQIWRKSVDFEGDVHHSWGNGSAGIALSRFLISNYYSNTFLKEEINIAINNIDKYLPETMNSDHSVGSGFLGMIEIRKILDPSYDNKKLLDDYIKRINNLNNIKCGGWNKNPLVTGLFYGFAGIGYNLLKLTKDNFL